MKIKHVHTFIDKLIEGLEASSTLSKSMLRKSNEEVTEQRLRSAGYRIIQTGFVYDHSFELGFEGIQDVITLKVDHHPSIRDVANFRLAVKFEPDSTHAYLAP